MSPRPRLLPDSAILSAAAKVLSRSGPERFTLADVGREVGLSAATLVQRFGSKRQLLLLMLEQNVRMLTGRFEAALESDQSPLAALYAAALDRADPSHGPSDIANGMAFMLLEINDPEFQAISAANANRAVDAYRTLLTKAIASGELIQDGIDTQALAETIHSMTLGSLMMWAILRDGSSKPRTRRDLDTVLGPYRAKGLSSAAHEKQQGPRSTTSAPARAD